MTEPIRVIPKIPIPATAIQFDGSAASYYACREFIGNPKADKTDPEDSLYVETKIGKREVQKTDWIVRDEFETFMVYGDGSFQSRYEKKT